MVYTDTVSHTLLQRMRSPSTSVRRSTWRESCWSQMTTEIGLQAACSMLSPVHACGISAHFPTYGANSKNPQGPMDSCLLFAICAQLHNCNDEGVRTSAVASQSAGLAQVS